MHKPLLIGIDGGATHCRARIVDAAGSVLGEATRRNSANVAAARNPKFVVNAILAAIRTAARRTGLTEAELKGAYAGFGLAGADVKSARSDLLRLFKEQGYFHKIEIRTDAYATWLGAHKGEDGAILILGTGSCGLAVVRGKASYVSGYGAEVSDEASGNWLGRQAVRRALWALDGRIERTPLAQAILACFHESAEAIIKFAKKATPAAYGEFAPSVFEYAEKRDALALALISDAASDAALMIKRLLDLGAPTVYLHGGLAERLSVRLSPAIRKRLKKPMNVEGVPLEGAILMARRIAATGGRAAARG
jgi:glucosamine kinase